MPENKLSAIEQLDKEYEESLKATPEAEPVVEEVKDEPAPVVEEKKAEQPKENKQDHAFKQMREENARIKKEKEEIEKRLQKLESIAKDTGFKSADDLIYQMEDKLVEQASQQQNVPKQVLRELDMTKKELQTAKEELSTRERQQRITAINSEIESISKNLKIEEAQMEEIVDQMGVDGYTVETLMMLPAKSIGKIVKGYASDYITEREVQTKLSTQKKAFKEEKHNTITKEVSSGDPFSSEALAKDLADYKKQNYPWMK